MPSFFGFPSVFLDRSVCSFRFSKKTLLERGCAFRIVGVMTTAYRNNSFVELLIRHLWQQEIGVYHMLTNVCALLWASNDWSQSAKFVLFVGIMSEEKRKCLIET